MQPQVLSYFAVSYIAADNGDIEIFTGGGPLPVVIFELLENINHLGSQLAKCLLQTLLLHLFSVFIFICSLVCSCSIFL